MTTPNQPDNQPVINPEWEKLGPDADVHFNPDAFKEINVGPRPVIPTKDYDTIRNEVLEEAAHELDLAAGEMFHDGKTFHYCAERIRKMKTNPK